nr:SH3 domain-containing protein [Amylibacter sp.]
MTRFFNITLLLGLAAVFYVQNFKEKPPEKRQAVVQSPVTVPAPKTVAVASEAEKTPNPVPKPMSEPEKVAAVEAAPSEPVPAAPDLQQKVLVVMSPKPETKPDPKPEPPVTAVTEPQDLDTAEIQARFAAAAIAERSQPDFADTVIAPLLVNAADQPTVEAVPKIWRVTGRLVNARAAPSTDSLIVDKLVRGTTVQDTGESDGLWSRVIVQDSGALVWMHRDFLADQS